MSGILWNYAVILGNSLFGIYVVENYSINAYSRDSWIKFYIYYLPLLVYIITSIINIFMELTYLNRIVYNILEIAMILARFLSVIPFDIEAIQ